MDDISGTQLRAVRAALFTAVAVTLSAASHVLLSRAPLPLPTVGAIAAAVFVIAYALAGRERGFGRIAALLVPLELAADTVFTTGQHVCYGAAGGPVAGPLRSFGFDVLCAGDVGTPLARMTGGGTDKAAGLFAHPDPAASWLLLGAHVTVGLLAALWLRRGEQALAQSLRALAAFAFRPLIVAWATVTAQVEPVARGLFPVARERAAHPRIWVHSVGRRGPPCPAA